MQFMNVGIRYNAIYFFCFFFFLLLNLGWLNQWVTNAQIQRASVIQKRLKLELELVEF